MIASRRAGAEPHAFAVAHRAGNGLQSLAAAIEAGADWVEADVWWQHGHLVARPGGARGRRPLPHDQWKLALAFRPELHLSELCDLLADGPELLIDFKGSGQRLPDDVVRCLRGARAIERAAICGQQWDLIDAAAVLEPRLRAYYSIGTVAQLGELRTRPPELPPIKAVSCAHALLTPAVIAELRERGLNIFAWTVNDSARAKQLLAAGVDGITTDSLEVLALVKDFRRTLRLS
jgi:hypothetical protein